MPGKVVEWGGLIEVRGMGAGLGAAAGAGVCRLTLDVRHCEEQS